MVRLPPTQRVASAFFLKGKNNCYFMNEDYYLKT